MKNLWRVVSEEEIFDLIHRYHNIQNNHSSAKATYSRVSYCLNVLVKTLYFYSVVNCMNDCYCILFISKQGFPNSGKGWGENSVGGWGGGGSEILLGENIFLPGKGNLRRSDFDDLNLFQR